MSTKQKKAMIREELLGSIVPDEIEANKMIEEEYEKQLERVPE